MVANYFGKAAVILGGTNPTQNRRSAIPRHREVNDRLAAKICADLGVAKV